MVIILHLRISFNNTILVQSSIRIFCSAVFSLLIFFPRPSWEQALGLSPRPGEVLNSAWAGGMPWDHGRAWRECASLPTGFMENVWKIQCNLESGYLESKLIRLIKGGLVNFRAAGVGFWQLLSVEPGPRHVLGHKLNWSCCNVGQAK